MLALLCFYESNTKESKKCFRVLSSVIYTILGNYVCIGYLYCLPKLLSTYPLNAGGGFKHEKNPYNNPSGIVIPYLLMNLMSCHGFMKIQSPIVILECPKMMSEYYFLHHFRTF